MTIAIVDLLSDIITDIEQLQQAGEHLPPVLLHDDAPRVDQLQEVLHVHHLHLRQVHCHRVSDIHILKWENVIN